MFNWIKNKWTAFGDWVQSWFPGFKTKFITAIGAIGSAAALLQEFVTGLPLSKFVTENQALGITLTLFALAFWFKRLSDRNT